MIQLRSRGAWQRAAIAHFARTAILDRSVDAVVKAACETLNEAAGAEACQVLFDRTIEPGARRLTPADYAMLPHLRGMKYGAFAAGEPPVGIFTTSRRFTEGDLEVLEAVASLLGTAIARNRAEEELRRLAGTLHSVQEDERRRLAREIHDELGQRLTGMRFDLDRALDWIDDSRARDLVTSSHAAAGSMIDLVRHIATQLRPPLLDDFGFVVAVRQEVAALCHRANLHCRVRIADELGALEDRVSVALYRIIQESLTNIARHADASNVCVTASIDGDRVIAEIVDDGRGIAPHAAGATTSLGLLGMRERALAFGGSVTVTPVPSGGTRVSVSLPLEAATPA
ncbi:MAG TPA: sensor histidine kinase [Thermoanaerobaculia bacterium]